ncbi:hypothetical protein [Caulobacter radicis]|nr:hypothetical protein [Caulobacter radicis]
MASTANRSSAHVVVYAALAGDLAIAALGVAGAVRGLAWADGAAC